MTAFDNPETEAARPRPEFDTQIPYVALADPKFLGLTEAKFTVTPEEASAADVEKFAAWLINPSVDKFHNPKTAFYATYKPGGPDDRSPSRVVPLNQHEHKIIVRAQDPRHLSRGVLSTFLSGKQSLNPDIRRAIDTGAAIGDEAIKARVVAMLSYLGTLQKRDEELSKFIESAFNPNLNRRKDIDTRVATTDVFFLQIPELLGVVGMLKGWDTDKFKRAERSVHYRMFFDREGGAHVRYGRGILDLMSKHNKEKIALIENRVEAAGIVLSEDG